MLSHLLLPLLSTCVLQAMEGGNPNTSGMPAERFMELTSHLSAPHCAFAAHWYSLVCSEEEGSQGARPQLWGLSGAQREELGTCLAGLQLLVSACRG